ncbi:MAG TPA: hypothetical protein DCE42_01860 [Myxococcales bacterium]|nr:hypothetical protein [Deltaproteobacteria bacterium]MBU52894.1 hypothetical protein [Deltaproteobacteria bacterium]HAA53469.1 hypothetical protein [Myxococcales bacterium]
MQYTSWNFGPISKRQSLGLLCVRTVNNMQFQQHIPHSTINHDTTRQKRDDTTAPSEGNLLCFLMKKIFQKKTNHPHSHTYQCGFEQSIPNENIQPIPRL